MRRLALLVVLALAAVLVPWVVPARAAPPPAVAPRAECVNCGVPEARGGEGSIVVRHGVSDHVPGRGSATQGRGAGDRDYSYVNEFTAPTCAGSGLHDNGILCSFALTSCPALDQVRFWIWHQTVSVKVGVKPGDPDVTTVGPWRQLEGTYCLGPDDPGVPDIVRTLNAAQDAFEQRVRQLPAPTTRSTPGPRTLVHYLTAFRAQNATPFSFDVTVAGATVYLHAVPTRFRWFFGDGTTIDTADASAAHTYAARGGRHVRVDVTWGGYFTVGSSPERYPIDPPARATGIPALVTVVQARAESVT